MDVLQSRASLQVTEQSQTIFLVNRRAVRRGAQTHLIHNVEVLLYCRQRDAAKVLLEYVDKGLNKGESKQRVRYMFIR